MKNLLKAFAITAFVPSLLYAAIPGYVNPVLKIQNNQVIDLTPGAQDATTIEVDNVTPFSLSNMQYQVAAGLILNEGTCSSGLGPNQSCILYLQAPIGVATSASDLSIVSTAYNGTFTQSQRVNVLAGGLLVQAMPVAHLRYSEILLRNLSQDSYKINLSTKLPASINLAASPNTSDINCAATGTLSSQSMCSFWFQASNNNVLGTVQGIVDLSALDLSNGLAVQQSFTLTNETDLYVGGGFYNIGGAGAMAIAKYNGQQWSPLLDTALSNGINYAGGAVAGFHLSATDLLVYGGFRAAGSNPNVNGVAAWNGQSWDDMNLASFIPQGNSLSIGGVVEIGNQLFAVQTTKNQGLILNQASGTWSTFTLPESEVYEGLFTDGNLLYLETDSNYIYDPVNQSWALLPLPQNNAATVFLGSDTNNTEIYLGGSFSTAQGTNLASYDAKTNSWLSLGEQIAAVYYPIFSNQSQTVLYACATGQPYGFCFGKLPNLSSVGIPSDIPLQDHPSNYGYFLQPDGNAFFVAFTWEDPLTSAEYNAEYVYTNGQWQNLGNADDVISASIIAPTLTIH